MRWARNYLKNYGLLENSARGVWSLTEEGYKTISVDKKKVTGHVRALHASRRQVAPEDVDETEAPTIDEIGWKEELLDLLKTIEPSAFERLSQRLLRELGFINVEVTGRPGDGGIDGKGNLSIGSVITFRVVFQCKRYKDSVSSEAIRQFRGAVEGRADKGLIVTTGKFTRNAREEAQRDGALAIDLLDGDELAEKLKELRLGVNVSLVENVSIDAEWFDRF